MGMICRACVDERGLRGRPVLEGDTRHLQFLVPASVLQLVESICRGARKSPERALLGVRYLVPLLAFVNGVEWTFVFLRFTGHLR